MSNPELESEILSRLVQLETSMSDRLARLEEQIEETRLLLPDMYRYGRLQNLLAASQWKEADAETIRIMQEIVGNDRGTVCTPEDIAHFCGNGTRILDRLWRKHSQNRFGFSIQLSLYQDMGGNIDTLRGYNNEILNRLGDKLGWHQNKRWLDFDEFDYTGELPVGSLPGFCWHSPYRPKMAHCFLMRLIECDILKDYK